MVNGKVKRYRVLFLGVVLFAACSKEPVQWIRVSRTEHRLPDILLSELYAKPVTQRLAIGVFGLENRSEVDQVLALQKKSCSCIDVYVDNKLISRGQQFILSPSVSTSLRIESPLSTKPAHHSFSVIIGVPEQNKEDRTVRFRLVAPVYADVELQPSFVRQEFSAADTDSVQRDISVTRTVRDKKLLSEPPKIGGLPPSVEVAGISKPDALREVEPGIWQRSWIIGLNIKPNDELAGTAPQQTAIVGFSGSDDYKENTASLPVIIRRKFGIDAPREIAFGAVVSGQPRTRRLLIRAADDREFEVLGTNSSSAALNANVSLPGANKQHWIDLAFQSEESGKFRETVVVRTNHPDSPRLEVRVEGLVLKRDRNSTATAGYPTESSN